MTRISALANSVYHFCCCSVAKLYLTLLKPHGLQPARFLCLWDFPDKITGVGCHFLRQGIFPDQGMNTSPALAGGFFITEPMSPALAGGFFITWEAHQPFSQGIYARKLKKSHPDQKERIQSSVFTNDMILYMKISENSLRPFDKFNHILG